MNELWQVALASPPYSQLTYGRPAWFPALEPGWRVLVPVRRSLRVGVVVESCSNVPDGVEVRDMLWPLDTRPLLDPDWMDLAGNLASRQMCALGEILSHMLPQGLRTASLTFEVDSPAFPRRLKPKDLAGLPGDRLKTLYGLAESGKLRVLKRASREGDEPHLHLAQDPPWPVRPNARRQIELLEYLLENGPQPVERVRRIMGPGCPAVERKLEASGLVRTGGPPDGMGADETEATCAEPPQFFDPSPEQAQAVERMGELLDSGRAASALVHGVTGSGKTWVYLEMAKRALAKGRNVLLLAPEVALACRLHAAAKERFPARTVFLYHGYQSPALREARFRAVAELDEPAVVVGTRSALFLPLARPGLIVVDEEHDESFKQEERLAYQAKELAWFRASRSDGLLVLGSATPDVKTFYAAGQGGVSLMDMPHRVGGACLPEVSLVDIGKLNAETPLAPASLAALRETVDQGEQAVILLNRRGYSPLMYCLDCGQVVRCADCAVAMTFHKARERLVCHYCGRSLPYPLVCPGCGGSNYLPMGEGTERLEEYLRKVLPRSCRVLRLDRDSTRRQERLEEILDDFARGRAQVLVGTQMLSKGHHFPQVTLALVADGDLGLNLPDYRAAERTFQLLVQVSGRSGRGERPGRVLIQTRNPAHPFWEHVLAGDYHRFYAKEITSRQRFSYPPFVKLGLVRMSFPLDYGPAQAVLADAARLLRERAGSMTVLGPAPAPLGMLRGRKRFNCLVKGTDWQDIRSLFAALRQWNPDPGQVRLGLDLDPVSML